MTRNVNPFGEIDILPISLNEEKTKESMDKAQREKKWVVAVVAATKPDFYKQWSLLPACDKLDIPNFVINTGQHYDEILGHGLDEFKLRDRFACDLAVRGDLLQKSSELITKIGWFGKYLKQNWPDVTVVPVVHGDTLVAAVAPIGWMFSRNEKVAQNEAGLRSMTSDNMKSITNKPEYIEDFIEKQWHGKWNILRNEPFPEQWDTFVAGAGTEFFFAPTDLNKEHLLREGYPGERIWPVGNSIIDAIDMKMKEKDETSVFDCYPGLEKKEDWIRVDIHRRENLTPKRFDAIIGGVVDLVEKGYNIVFIELNATKTALEKHDLREKLMKLGKKDNFLFSGVWPKYAHVIEFLNSGKCFAELTDSGSMQEELNELGKVACLTCRFSTDRPETVFKANTNLLVPPISREWVVGMVDHVYKSEDVRKTLLQPNKLYGKDVGDKITKIFSDLMAEDSRTFSWAHETLKLWKEKPEKNNFSYL